LGGRSSGTVYVWYFDQVRPAVRG